MNLMNIRCIALFAMLLTGFDGLCQVNEYPFSKLDIRDGLSNNHVNAIYKDHRGFLWFGTTTGLTRYDGYTCKVFLHNDQDSTSLTDDNVNRIFDGPEDKLWISTSNGTIFMTPERNVVLHAADSCVRFICPYGVGRYLPVEGFLLLCTRIRGFIFIEPGPGNTVSNPVEACKSR